VLRLSCLLCQINQINQINQNPQSTIHNPQSTRTMKFSPLLLTLLPALVAAQTAAKCSFLPAADAPAIELMLPAGALTHPLQELPIEFRGVTPIVTRKTLAAGSMPKITVSKYSSEPTIVYDDLTGKVIVSAGSCSGGDESGAPLSRSATTWLPLAGATLLAGVASGPTAAASVAAAGLLQGAHAQEEACMPVVQLLVEAPNSYVGAVETCLAEINDPAICPDPFPQFATCDDPAPSCGLAVVGAGAGGLYTALRYVRAGSCGVCCCALPICHGSLTQLCSNLSHTRVSLFYSLSTTSYLAQNGR
jgi:hypothetical protein